MTAYRSDRWGLRTKIVAGNIVALAVLLVVLGLIVRVTVRSVLMASVQRRLRAEVHSVPPPWGRFSGHGERGGNRGGPSGPPRDGRFGDRGGPGGPPPDENGGVSQNGPGMGTTYSVRHFDLSGKALGFRPLLDAQAFTVVKAGDVPEYDSVLQIDDEPVQVLTIPYREHGQMTAIVQAGYPLTEVYQAMHGLDMALLLLMPLGLFAAGLFGTYLTAQVLRSVRQTARSAERIGISAEGELSDRLPVVGRDEFAELAATFNDLLGRLETTMKGQARLLAQQRRFTADASHELKTPLTVIRGMTSMALDESMTAVDPRLALQKIDTASQNMAQLVQDLLLLARSDSGQSGIAHIDLPVRDLLVRASSGVLPTGATVIIDVPDETLCVRGSEIELVRVFSNLLDNAMRHTSPPGSVRLSAVRSGEQALIQVTDTGTGIAPEHLPHLGERFYRIDSSRARTDGGTGLGLSICKSIVETHGGSLMIASALEKGTTVSVRLPLTE